MNPKPSLNLLFGSGRPLHLPPSRCRKRCHRLNESKRGLSESMILPHDYVVRLKKA